MSAIVPELLLLAPGMGLQRAQCAFLKEVKKNQKVRAKLQKSFDHKMFSKILKSIGIYRNTTRKKALPP